ncbi:teneurin-m isoform X2 [Anopheles funestus]|uniref:teneurin-m isoform X2 n=1 Tax=Anopheles funestus TaxID=62324 RepID=UPI0020C64A30|nr:teneurin-m isoform X2 [Anopheles funestus]
MSGYQQQGKSRHYPRYSLNSSDNEDSPIHRSIYAQPYNAIGTAERQSNFTYRSTKGTTQAVQATVVNPLTLNTPSSENGSSATLTDAEASLARENTLLVNNGCLLDGVPPSAPPDVPPRNPTMNRMNGRVTGNPTELGVDFEPSCLVRTPSGNVYIPSGNLAINNKGSPIDYKTGSACSTPTKDTLKSYDRNCMGPVLPPRSTMCGPPAHHYSAPLNFRKGFTFTKCTWKCTAILVILLSVILVITLLLTASNVLSISYPTTNPCTVLVDEKAEISAAKSTIADANRAGIPGGGGDGLGIDQSLSQSASGRPKPIAADESSPSSSAASGTGSAGSSSLSAASTAATGKAASGATGTGTVTDKRIVASPPSVELLHAVADSTGTTRVKVGDGSSSDGSSGVMVVVKRSRRQATGDSNTGTDTGSADRNDGPTDGRFDDNDLLHASVVDVVASTTTPPSIRLDGNAYSAYKQDTDEDEPAPEQSDQGKDELLPFAQPLTNLLAATVGSAGGETAVNNGTVYNGRNDGDEPSLTDMDGSLSAEDIQAPDDEGFGSIASGQDNGIFITNDNDLPPATMTTVTSPSGPLKTSAESYPQTTLTNEVINARLTDDEDEKWSNDDPSAVHGAIYGHVPLDQSDVALVSLEDGLELGKVRDKHYYKTIEQVAIKENAPKHTSTAEEEPLEEVRIHTLPESVLPVTVQPTVPMYLIKEVNGTSSSEEGAELPRLLVNISIATDHGSGTVQHSVYVLQVSIPTPPEHMPRPAADEPKPANFEQPPPVPQCPPEPPPAPPCPIKCPTDSLFARYRVVDVQEDDSEFVELDEDAVEPSVVAVGQQDEYELSTESPEALEANDGLTQEFTTPPRLVQEQELTDGDDDDDDATSTSSIASTTSAAQCPEVTPPPILILEARSFPPDGTTFSQITLGQRLSKEIPPYSYWNMQFYQSEPAYVKFDYSIPRGASIGVYARRNALPTHTQYHFKEVLSGFNARQTRATHPSMRREVTRYMEPGHWFLSIYNDDGDAQEIAFYAVVAEDMTQNCPNGCSGNGQCLLGHCQCNPGFGGDDCSESVCPVLCSQRGEYINGECQCNPGWKGKECSLRHDECEVPDCNGHGHCVSGKCGCVRGYKGKYCEEVDCPHPTCTGHGFCAEGTCICKKGWKGPDCATMDQDALQCLPDCSGHGTFDLDSQTCTCEPKWSGEDCSKELCDLNCGQHGRCVGETCSCDAGWGGEYCNNKLCDPRCNEHGQCKNGTCLCVTGWNGKHCTLEGCPNGCSQHGQCHVSGELMWECRCYEGWDGVDCSVPLEQNCGDNKDNDRDGLVDCEDPECCGSHSCKTSQLCVSAPKPIDVLLRKQPPAITASFFERMKFLIDEGSLQNYAKLETFNESVFWNHFNASRSAVIRGRVVTSLNMGLVGVRVSTSTPLEGFTLTRDDGWFDLMVNGGGAITLQFGRSPFRPQTRIVQVPWNEVVIIDTVVMSTSDDKSHHGPPHTCFSHDYDLMKPVVLATWKHGFQGACPDRSAILAESQVIQESLAIPGTGLNLVYHSSRAAGYLSTIKLQLTPDTIPPTLKLIYLRITIEGILFERVFEADPGIKFTYPWNRLNIYRQRVYGITTAVVKVGYQYTDCKDVVWDVQTTKLSGHDMSISEVGGWNLDIHHRYNFHEGILQKGDGSNIYLKHKPRVILTAMGDGHQRPLECGDCNGIATKQRLLAPVALAAAPDGSLYVGDFNYIRRIMIDGTVRTVVKLNATRVSYRYHMALSPLDGSLYVSDPESHQIIKVRNKDDTHDPDHNWEPVVGSGERCLPGDEAHCGDGGLARDAKLAYPKGVAISSDNILYFADGTNIRMVDRDGVISTLIGNHMHKSHWKPVPCEGTLKIEEMHLRWPTELTINPLDDTLHIIDDHMILRMTPDGRVRVIAGRPMHCATAGGSGTGTGMSTGVSGSVAAALNYDTDLAIHATLVMPQSIAFAPSGDLYVAESDSQRINRIRVIGTDGKIAPYAGAESKCNCLERGCDCYEADHYLAISAKFNTISAITVTPDGHVHIADQANYRIRSVISSLPEAGTSKEYEIYAPNAQEIYVFNRFGQHIATKNIMTGETVYSFLYNVNTSNGKLSTVTDAAGNKVFLLRDYTSQVNSIENTKGQKCRLRMTRMKMLHELNTPDNYNVTFEYHGPTGLLKTKLDSTGRSYVYNYDEFGRLTSAVTPTGKVIDLTFDLSVQGATVKVTENSQREVSMLIQGSSVVSKVGEAATKTTVLLDGGTTSVSPWGNAVSVESVPYVLLAEVDPLLGESYPVPSKQRTEINGDLSNRFEWRYFIRHVPVRGKNARTLTQVGRKLRVNGENLLTFEYEKDTSSITVSVDDKTELLNVTYDKSSRPIAYRPQSGEYADVDLEYDRFGRLISWKWGNLKEEYTFDRAGRLNEIKYGDGSSIVYAFKDTFSSLPLKVTTPRRSDYLLQYDDAGALQSLTTPRGHIHAFSLQTSLGFFKYQYYSPINRHPFEILYSDEGQILAKIHPHQSGKVAFVHDSAGRLETVLAGLSSTQYTYQESTSLVKQVEVLEPGFELRREFKYHAGVLKDEKLKFGSKSGLASAHFKYQYDGNARLSGIEMDVNGKELPIVRFKYGPAQGTLDAVSDLRITRNAFNRTVVQDTSKQFFTITDFDEHGRVKSVLINIKSFDVYRLELDYDLRNRIRTHKVMVGRSTSLDKVNYNADGHVMEVVGTNSWKYVYDENGNIIGILEQGDKTNLGYDTGDRVVQVGDVEFNSYDARGYVVRRGEQKYRYNNRGQLIHAMERDRFQTWYFYDDLGRLVACHDEKGNVTQYFYANLNAPELITHIHYPKAGRTSRLLYDDRHMLIAIETGDQRYYVATDQNGSPIALFDIGGAIVKEIRRTPFGKIVKDTNPGLFVPIDFHGGLLDPNTRLVYMEQRLYDTGVGQWMTPAWEQLATEMRHPTDVFIYRFHNNDPINRREPEGNYMNDLRSWLKLFGYDVTKMQGSRYTRDMIYRPTATIKSPQLAPDFGVMSGLQCIVEKVDEKFADFGFIPKPLLKMELKTRNLLPRVAYRRGVFGEGVLISRIDGRALVSVVDGSNSVVQDVVSSVFNNSHFLDLHFSIHDQDVFYFVKDNVMKLRDDTEELRRLGGMFNISAHEINDHGGANGKELRLHGPDAVVIIKYGVDPEQERHRILKHAHKRAVERAWELEKQLVAAGFQGRGDWTEEEKEELISHGDVDGWIGVDIHSIHKYPQLADDPGNVAFQRDSKRKRRKSGGTSSGGGGGSHKAKREHRHETIILPLPVASVAPSPSVPTSSMSSATSTSASAAPSVPSSSSSSSPTSPSSSVPSSVPAVVGTASAATVRPSVAT